jgi:hypothetical protein
MRDYLSIGSSPYDEDCAQVGSCDYERRSRKELRAFKHQLQRLFPNAEIAIKSFPHDFGTYREVCVFFDDEDEASTDIALNVESNTPAQWDKEALREMEEIEANYRKEDEANHVHENVLSADR